MSGVHGNDNLAWLRGCQFLTIDGTSDSVTLPENIQAVEIYSDVVCWVQISRPGESPTVAAPGAEKTEIEGFFLPATTVYPVPVPDGNAANPIKVTAIQAAGAGTLYVNYRSFV